MGWPTCCVTAGAELPRDGAEMLPLRQCRPVAGEDPLAFSRKPFVELLGKNEPEDGVSEKLEALVVLGTARPVLTPGRVGQSAFQQLPIAKPVPELFLQRHRRGMMKSFAHFSEKRFRTSLLNCR